MLGFSLHNCRKKKEGQGGKPTDTGDGPAGVRRWGLRRKAQLTRKAVKGRKKKLLRTRISRARNKRGGEAKEEEF